MKTMKTIVLFLVLVLGMTACGGGTAPATAAAPTGTLSPPATAILALTRTLVTRTRVNIPATEIPVTALPTASPLETPLAVIPTAESTAVPAAAQTSTPKPTVPTDGKFVASSAPQAKLYYCKNDPGWRALAVKNLVWSDDAQVFIQRGLKLHKPC